MELREYRKYYFLENYLFNDVHRHFNDEKRLTPFQLFAIVIWKANRDKGRLKSGIEEGGPSVQDISSILARIESNDEKSKRDALKDLTNGKIRGIGIPVASAILSALYPNDFTVVDYRVRDVFKEKFNIPLRPNPCTSINGYFKYVAVCKEKADERGFGTLREFDQALWGYSFFKDLEDYIKDLR